MNHSPRRELLSIIVPVYNEVRTVLAVIERLLAIDLPIAREILVVNDGSTDGTREVLETAGIRDSGFGIRWVRESRRIPNHDSRITIWMYRLGPQTTVGSK